MAYKYGSDGAFVAPITDAMITTGFRDVFKSSGTQQVSALMTMRAGSSQGELRMPSTGHGVPLPLEDFGEEYILSV